MQPIQVAVRSRAATSRVLGLRVRISPRTWKSVVSVVLSGRGLSLRRADHSSRGALTTLARRYM